MVKVIESMSNQSPKLHIATLGRTVGLHGDMKFHIKCDFPEQFQVGSTFYGRKDELLVIADIDMKKDLIRIKGYESLESAKKLTNVKLFTTMEKTRAECHLEEGQHFWFDIEGCEVFDHDCRLGKVNEVERIGITDYLSVDTDEGLIAQGKAKRFLIPYGAPYVLATDIDAKRISTEGAMDILDES